MKLTFSTKVDVNEDGQITIKTTLADADDRRLDLRLDPIVIPRAHSAALAKAVIAAQEGGK